MKFKLLSLCTTQHEKNGHSLTTQTIYENTTTYIATFRNGSLCSDIVHQHGRKH